MSYDFLIMLCTIQLIIIFLLCIFYAMCNSDYLYEKERRIEYENKFDEAQSICKIKQDILNKVYDLVEGEVTDE